MATILTTNPKEKTSQNSGKRSPLFRPINYILMIAGALVLVIGYLCLRGGAVDDPNTFNGEIFNSRRLVVSPILMFIGLVTEIFAIMWHPRAQKKEEVQD